METIDRIGFLVALTLAVLLTIATFVGSILATLEGTWWAVLLWAEFGVALVLSIRYFKDFRRRNAQA
jgi:hypothetical protein